MAGRKNDIGSLACIPIAPRGSGGEVGGKQGDLTPLLLLAPDAVKVFELAPDVAPPEGALVADLAIEDAPRETSFFADCARRIRRFVLRLNRQA